MVERNKQPLDAAPWSAAMVRLVRLVPIIGGSGAIGALIFLGWRFAVGFLIGAAISWFNFHLLHKLVSALGPGGSRPSTFTGFMLIGRYLLLGAAGFAIVKLLEVNSLALLTGLFTPVVAVLVSILYEIIYART